MKVTVKFRIVAVIFFAFMLVHSASAKAEELYFVDAHSQVDDTVVPLNTVISLMEQGGVTHTLLSTRGKIQGKALLVFVEQYPDRITPAIRTKGKPYNVGSPRYYKALMCISHRPFNFNHYHVSKTL